MAPGKESLVIIVDRAVGRWSFFPEDHAALGYDAFDVIFVGKIREAGSAAVHERHFKANVCTVVNAGAVLMCLEKCKGHSVGRAERKEGRGIA